MGTLIACDKPEPFAETSGETSLSDLVSALSYALDLATGQPMGHAVQSCLIALRLAGELHLDKHEREHLYYAVLLKDAGSSGNAAEIFRRFGADDIALKRDAGLLTWQDGRAHLLRLARQHLNTAAPGFQRMRTLARAFCGGKHLVRDFVQAHCEQGASLACRMGFPEPVAVAIRCSTEDWNGRGLPHGLAGDAIPRIARILKLAQTLEVFYTHRSAKIALDTAQERSGTCFDPELVRAALALSRRGALFADLESGRTREALLLREPAAAESPAARIDSICAAFAAIADAKTPHTAGHSERVALTALRIAGRLGTTSAEMQSIRRAALLHDLGKLAIPNRILEKPGKLDPAEWQTVKKHPYYTMEIVRRICGFSDIAEIAASHHEKLDGSGYYRNLTAPRLPLAARILAVADIFEALSAKRPFRDALPEEKIREILRSEAPRQLDPECVEAVLA
jgi:putative nucleotidyltransferase with HDIG domain